MKDVSEEGNNRNNPINVEVMKSIFIEMLRKREEILLEHINSVSTPTNQRIEKLSAEITGKNEKLVNLFNEGNIHRNFAMQPAAEKSFYLRLTVKKMHAFAVFIEQYLQPYGCSSTNFTAVV